MTQGRLMGGKGALPEYSRPTLGLTAVPRAVTTLVVASWVTVFHASHSVPTTTAI